MPSEPKPTDKELVISRTGNKIEDYPIFQPEDILTKEECDFIKVNVRDGFNDYEIQK